MVVDLYMNFQKCHCFWLEKRDSTYTRIDLLYTRENMVVLDFCGEEEGDRVEWGGEDCQI